MKKVVSIIILLVIFCYSCNVFAASYSISVEKESAIAEKVINNKQGKIENKITSTDKLMNLVYGEINFTNKIYTSASESEQKKVTEIYIMIPEDIVNLDSYAQYQKYIEEFSKKVFERNKNTKIGIIGIKGPISSMEIVDGKGIIKDDDEYGKEILL